MMQPSPTGSPALAFDLGAETARPATDRHVQEVVALRHKRQRAAIPWAARAAALAEKDPVSAKPFKTVHFIRHGQAVHNWLAAKLGAKKCGCKRSTPDGTDSPKADCPYNAPAAFDPPLTEEGREQAEKLMGVARGVQLIVSSPLRRTLQTALHAFSGVDAPVIAHEDLREQVGMHQCDRRRDTDAIRAEFGERVCLAGLRPADELWSLQREPKDSVADRSTRFIQWLMERPEHEIAVTTHHHTLLVLFNCVLQTTTCTTTDSPMDGPSHDLCRPFEVGEMRSIRLCAL